jgi:hypothetical protein
MRTIVRTITGLMLLINWGTAAASEAEDAIEFMLTGDAGWSGAKVAPYSNISALKDCKTSFTQTLVPGGLVPGGGGVSENTPLVIFDVVLDWNNVIWNSAWYKYKDMSPENRYYFYVDCKGVCTSVHAEGELGPMLASALSPTQITFPILTSRERFENALKVLVSECPGVSTKF